VLRFSANLATLFLDRPALQRKRGLRAPLLAAIEMSTIA
jgi:hypothetical protein